MNRRSHSSDFFVTCNISTVACSAVIAHNVWRTRTHWTRAPSTSGVKPGVLGVATPRFWAGDRGVAGGRGSRGRVVKYYFVLSLYRKYFRKWWHFKRNRI